MKSKKQNSRSKRKLRVRFTVTSPSITGNAKIIGWPNGRPACGKTTFMTFGFVSFFCSTQNYYFLGEILHIIFRKYIFFFGFERHLKTSWLLGYKCTSMHQLIFLCRWDWKRLFEKKCSSKTALTSGLVQNKILHCRKGSKISFFR